MSKEQSITYDEIFQRNIGIFTRKEQERLRRSTVSIAGLGGVGSVLLERLVRLGIENFKVADPDVIEASNLNRQIHSDIDSIGKDKAPIIIDAVKKINPSVKIEYYKNGVNEENVASFVESDLVIDAVEYNKTYYLYLLHKAAREANKNVLAGQAIGFDSTLFVFSPESVRFEDYIGLKNPETLTPSEINDFKIPINKFCPKLPAYVPKTLALSVFLRKHYIPSCSLGVISATVLLEMLTIRLLLGKGKARLTPDYYHLDIYNI